MYILSYDSWDEKEFKEDEDKLIYFSASWCAQCKTMDHILKGVIESSDKDITIYKVNPDNENMELAKEHQVRSLPTLVRIKDNEVYKKHAGIIDETSLQEELDL